MRTWSALLTLAVASAVLAAQERGAPGADSIVTTDLEADVRYLASTGLAGRRTGTEGNRRAAEFIAGQFSAHGLSPVGTDGTHFQRFDLMTTALGDENRLQVEADDDAAPPRLGADFYPDPVSATGTAAGPVVFTGFGIDAPALAHTDYGPGDLDGAVALLMDHEPGEFDAASRFDGDAPSEDSRVVRKVLAAQHRGAVAVLLAPDLHNHPGREGFARAMAQVWPVLPSAAARYELAAWVREVEIPVMRITAALATRLAETAGRSFADLAAAAERTGGEPPVALDGARVAVTASVTRGVVPNRNVVGLIEGTAERARDEWIIISAHYDHEGEVNGAIYRGADDDASGVAGLLEIAEAYAIAARDGIRPRRSILLAAWNSEEQGLLGAWAYTQAPLRPLDQTVAVLNMDMIGRNEEVPEGGDPRFRGLHPQTGASNRNAVNLLGYSRSPDLRQAAERANRTTDLDLKFRYDDNQSNLLRRSDQWPFLYRGVPALFVHTGLHPDYHTPRDLPETLNYEKMTRIVRMVYQLSWNLAQARDRPVYSAP